MPPRMPVGFVVRFSSPFPSARVGPCRFAPAATGFHRIGNSRPGNSSSGSTLRDKPEQNRLHQIAALVADAELAEPPLEPGRGGLVHRDERRLRRLLDRLAVGEEVLGRERAELGRAHDALRRQEVDARGEEEVRVAEAHALALELGDEAAPAGVLGQRLRHLRQRRERAGGDQDAEQHGAKAAGREPRAKSSARKIGSTDIRNSR